MRPPLRVPTGVLCQPPSLRSSQRWQSLVPERNCFHSVTGCCGPLLGSGLDAAPSTIDRVTQGLPLSVVAQERRVKLTGSRTREEEVSDNAGSQRSNRSAGAGSISLVLQDAAA